jgi:hypothetical protein
VNGYDHSKLANYDVEELIDGLQDETSEGLGTHSTAWADGFLASEDEPKLHGGIIGSAKPNVSPVMREIVRRGVTALPRLLDHLEDCRPTRLVIKLPFDGFGGMRHSDEYDPRYADKSKQPPDVNQGGAITDRYIDGEYNVRVGDLCFVITGQIVNRSFNVVRYRPSACIVISSPVETPSLAHAVRTDWADLTVQQHRMSLLQDSTASSKYVVAGALARLRFFYPEAAAKLDLKAP